MLRSAPVSYSEIDALQKAAGQLVVCTVVKTQGSVPRHVGARLVVLPDGTTQGTVGGGLFEAKVVEDALACLQARSSETKTYDFRPEGASPEAFGAVCGGRSDIFFEVVAPHDLLLIIGGGHCGRALARAAALLSDLAVTLIESRDALTDREDLPASVTVSPAAPDFTDLRASISSRTFVVLVTQGYTTDRDALRQVLLAEDSPAYIGMMGSRKKVRTVREDLLAEGIPAEHLDQIHAPIGLEIGAETPAEIAIAILAQIIAVRSGTAVSKTE
jgi:xanthine dehydrogenase accessory factor